MKSANRKKFTLIELLVVVAIIGILVSLLLPSLKNARTASMTTVSISNLKQIYVGTMKYASENNHYLFKTNNNSHEYISDDSANFGRLVFEAIQGKPLGPNNASQEMREGSYKDIMFCPVLRQNRGEPRYSKQGASHYSMNVYFRTGNKSILKIGEGKKEPFIVAGSGTRGASTTFNHGTYNPDVSRHPSYEYLNQRSIGLFINGNVRMFSVAYGTENHPLINERGNFE